MVAILGVGAVGLREHPESLSAVGEEATRVASRTFSDVAKTVEAVAGSNAAVQSPSPAQDKENNAVISNHNTRSDDDDFEDDDDDEDGDDQQPTSQASSGASATTQTPTPESSSGGSGSVSVKTYTLADIAAHNSKTSCYTAISGLVYDLTPFISQHPGGVSRIMSLCGIDGTVLYGDQHGGEKRPADELSSLKIGVVAP